MSYRVLLIGGGSGGHVYPLVAVANAMRAKAQAQNLNLQLLMMGDDGFFAQAAAENGIPFKRILAGKIRRYFDPTTLLDIFAKIPVGFIQSLWHMYWFMPDVIFSKGGYDSVPPALAGRLYLIPLYIHESDSYPGLANSFLSHFARRVFISFQTVTKYLQGARTELVGNPTRPELMTGNRDESRNKFNLSPEKKAILVMGGSQGAKQINDLILASLVQVVGVPNNYQILHQCGETQLGVVQAEVDKILAEGEGRYADSVRANYRLMPFFSTVDMKAAYAACDLIISRAGAGSIFEIAALGKPAIIIPLHPSAGDHQFLNAVEFSKAGAVMIEGDDVTTNVLINQIQNLFEPERYAQVSQQIRNFAAPQAADKIADALLAKS